MSGLATPRRARRAIAVALHDVEPATFERCALIRDWLGDHGVARVTLLVIPARDLHPFFQRRPDLADWLLDCRDRGDAVAQHGFQHRRTRRPGGLRAPLSSWQGGRAAEFGGLGPAETRASVDAGWRMLSLAGLEPRGFVAPAYAYTPALHELLRSRFAWWATHLRLLRGARRPALAPALTLGTSSAVKRALSPALVRAGGLAAGPLLRLDLHPADFDHPRHVLALEAVLRRAGRREALTYDDLA